MRPKSILVQPSRVTEAKNFRLDSAKCLSPPIPMSNDRAKWKSLVRSSLQQINSFIHLFPFLSSTLKNKKKKKKKKRATQLSNREIYLTNLSFIDACNIKSTERIELEFERA